MIHNFFAGKGIIVFVDYWGHFFNIYRHHPPLKFKPHATDDKRYVWGIDGVPLMCFLFLVGAEGTGMYAMIEQLVKHFLQRKFCYDEKKFEDLSKKYLLIL